MKSAILIPIASFATIFASAAPVDSLTPRASCPTNGVLVCNGTSEAGICNNGEVTFQPVAEGTECVDGQIVSNSTAKRNAPSTAASCTQNGELICNGLYEFGLCNFGKVIFEPVAAGTECKDGEIVAVGSSRRGVSCSPDGALICNGLYEQGLCNLGEVTFQPVAAGTECVDGEIVTA